MARRSKDWNEGLAEDLQDPAFAREFLAAAVEDGVPLQQALGKVIRATGVKEFAATVGMSSSNVLRAIHPRHNPTQETLDRLLKPFGLRIGLAEIKRRRGRAPDARLATAILVVAPSLRSQDRGNRKVSVCPTDDG